jgi:hypothetical protein
MFSHLFWTVVVNLIITDLINGVGTIRNPTGEISLVSKSDYRRKAAQTAAPGMVFL